MAVVSPPIWGLGSKFLSFEGAVSATPLPHPSNLTFPEQTHQQHLAHSTYQSVTWFLVEIGTPVSSHTRAACLIRKRFGFLRETVLFNEENGRD